MVDTTRIPVVHVVFDGAVGRISWRIYAVVGHHRVRDYARIVVAALVLNALVRVHAFVAERNDVAQLVYDCHLSGACRAIIALVGIVGGQGRTIVI